MAAPMKFCGKSVKFARVPPVIVIGATGTGKSQLAIELALTFNGEIISADSMQVYHGLDVVTNKVTKTERDTVSHHLIDYVSPHKTSYNVWDYRNHALPIIDRLMEENKTPIIVGGTNYYIEALLWNMLVDTPKEKNMDVGIDNVESVEGRKLTRDEVDKQERCRRKDDRMDMMEGRDITTEVLYQQLAHVDLATAQRLHPHNRRRIIRALEVHSQHNMKLSDILAVQHEQVGQGAISGSLCYPDAVILWITCNQPVLDTRTDKRVHTMLKEGLLQELTAFHHQYNQDRLQNDQDADYTEGIFQSIGFKEFHEFLKLDIEKRKSDDGQKLQQKAIEEMKLVTRRYSRKQKKWIVNRFLKRRGQNVPAVYMVDSSCPETWEKDVSTPAINIITAIMKGELPSQEPLPTEENTNLPQHNVCDVCNVVCVTTQEWQAHMKGRKHKKAVERKHREQKLVELDEQNL